MEWFHFSQWSLKPSPIYSLKSCVHLNVDSMFWEFGALFIQSHPINFHHNLLYIYDEAILRNKLSSMIWNNYKSSHPFEAPSSVSKVMLSDQEDLCGRPQMKTGWKSIQLEMKFLGTYRYNYGICIHDLFLFKQNQPWKIVLILPFW